VIVAHIMGLPVEESVLQLTPLGGAIISAFVVAGRSKLGRLRRSIRQRRRSTCV
jgi:hypothetical protein